MQIIKRGAQYLDKFDLSLQGERAFFMRAINAGTHEVLEIGDCFFIITVEHNELVICCAEGKKIVEAGRALFAKAKQNGVKKIRFHTKRKALKRLLNEFAPKLREYVYEIEV